MKLQYIGVIAALALLAACAPKHNNTMATRLSKAERQILKKKTQPATKPTPAPGKGSTNTGSGTGGTSAGTAGSGKGSGSSGKTSGSKSATNPSGSSKKAASTTTATIPAQPAGTKTQQAQDNMTVVPPNQTNAGTKKIQATARIASATCRLTTAAPTSGDIGSGNGSALQAINSYFASEPYCNSTAVSVANGEMVLPANLYQQKNVAVALQPTKVSTLGAYTSYTFQSLTPKTGRLVLTYLLPGVASKFLTQADAKNISVIVSYNADSKNVEPFALSSFRLESVPTKTSGDMAVVHVLQASDLKYANYTLLIQVPNKFISGLNPGDQYLTNREIPIPATSAITSVKGSSS